MLDAIIVGAGLAGLSCARHLEERGLKVKLFEASNAVGGRIRTDVVDGFRLDRGFQVLLDSYPEAQRQLDLPSLGLKAFQPGALVRIGGRFHELVDPWRRPWSVLSTLTAPIGTLRDKFLIAKLKTRSTKGTIQQRFQDPETSTWKALQEIGFSESMVERFFRPFLGGVFLDSKLETSSRMLDFVFRMFSYGNACLPSEGMEAIPRQLAARLSSGTVQLNRRVARVHAKAVVFDDGTSIEASSIVVAVEGPSVESLLDEPSGPFMVTGQGVTCFYYAAEKSPLAKPILVLNGEGQGPINNLCVPSDVCASYSSDGRSLVSVTVLGVESNRSELEQAVRQQLMEWYGPEVGRWEHVHCYTIPFALPTQPVSWLEPFERSVMIREGLYVCGDHRDQASIQGALVSGRRTAEAVGDYWGMHLGT